MACWFEYNGKRYEPDELVGVLKAMPPVEAAKYIPGIKPVPEAPFQKSWHELALKDAIREAAEKNIDRISWTPGEAQAARYDLSKQISEVRWSKTTHDLQAKDHNGEVVMRESQVPPEKLPDYIGKEAADKVVNSPSEKSPNREIHFLRGLDLKVGGEGMKGFYDKMIPDAMNKIGKPHGVKVESGTTRIHPSYWAGGPREPIHRPEQHAPVHYMDIPPSLKEQALKKGFSMFEDTASTGAPVATAEHDKDRAALEAAIAVAHNGKNKQVKKNTAIQLPQERSRGGFVNPAMDIARSIKRAKGGRVHVGPIVGDTGGRADKVPMEVPDGAYILTADHVSGMGEGNSGAGMKKLSKMFPKSKPSLMRSLPKRKVKILAAHGEFCVSPADIVDRYGSLDKGHRILDHWQTSERKNLIDTLRGLAPPAQD